MDNAIAISARLVHALEKLSGGIPITGPVTNTSITANRKATTERPINTLTRFCIALLLTYALISFSAVEMSAYNA